MIRLGRIAYVNMAPVFYRVEAEYKEVAGVPTALNDALLGGDCDLAPISSIEYARHADRLRILPRLCVSSQGAVALIRVFGLPVLREGNVIDLGLIKLQVAEACSGLRYLFPLATFTFLCAYLFISRPLTRIFIFLSSIPITIGMNIFRIGATAVLVDPFQPKSL